MDNEVSPVAVIGSILGGIFVLWLLIFGISYLGARWTPEAGQIGVVRDGSSAVWVGDWFNGHNIKQVVPPGSGNTSIGLGATVHAYPADSVQRFYTITSDPSRGDRPGVDVVTVPTSDGINVGLEGTIYFTTAFNGSPQGEALVRDFDNRFGVRTFPVVGQQGVELHAYDGNDGWSAFLDAVVRPVIDNDLRQQVASFTCAQLQSSCALVYQTTGAPKLAGTTNNASIAAIQDSINKSLQADLQSTLGHDYFSQVQFRLARVTLPDSIQAEIEKAQAQYAAVGSAKAQVEQATLQAKANEERQKGYQSCPACAAIDELKAIPSNVTTFAPGAGFAITAK